MDNELDIAIIGMSGRFPGARDLDEFWHNLAEGVESIARLSDQEILESGVPASHLSKPGYVKAAPVLEEPGHFDAGFFGFSPMEAKTMDPQHRLLLELAYEALEHAGYDPERYPGRIGAFAGSAMNTYFTNIGLNSRLAEEYIPTLIGNDKDFLSTRISYKLNLKGPSITVQTACSTSLVAVHLACQSLLSEETDMALAGAVSVRVPHRAGYFCDGGGVVSPDGHVRAFDAKANGTVFGSGGGILVLKRLADALSDGDSIHAVIRGSAVNNDGSEKAGYTAPSVNSQADAVVEALANARVEADSISYIEAHGSGTPVGDPIEIRALTKAFRSFTQRSGFCAIGSVKTNVGHLDAAAAVAGMIKTVLALKHRKLPPSLHFSEANPEIDFSSTPFCVNTCLREWASDGPRRAGVMSTGMGGTNAHVVLEEAPEPAASPDARAPHLLVLSAKTETALDQATHRLREFLSRNDSVNMSDVAYTLQIGRKAFPHRRCLVCADREDALAALGQEDSKRLLPGRTDESRRSVILLLPGVGDHYVGMAYDLYETWDVFKQEVDRCADILRPHLGIDIRTVIYPKTRSWKTASAPKGIDLKRMLGRSTDAPDDPDAKALNQTRFAQPALFTIEYATARLWQFLGVTPDAIVGHSMGEYVAACLAGVLSLEDALRLIATRAKLVDALPQGAMLAVTLAENELLPLLPEDLSISLINGPRLCVVAGAVAAVAEFERTLSEKGVICRHVQNAHAFHSKMLDPVVKAFEAEVNKVRLNEPKIPYISNVTGTWITRSEATDPAYWAKHANHTARFSDALHALWQFKDPILLEAGPGRTLGVLAMQHPDRSHGGEPVAVSSIRHDYENQSDVEFLWHGIGRLWLSGAEIKWDEVHRGKPRRRVSLPTYPFERQHHWLEPLRVPDAAPRAPVSVHKNPNPSEWLYVPSWKRLLPRAVGIHETALLMEKPGTWLVFADGSGFASVLTTRLKAAGQHVVSVRGGRRFQQLDPRTFTIEPANSQHYDLLVRALQANRSLPDHIVHAWSFTGIPAAQPEGDGFARAQTLGFYSLVFLAKTLAARNVRHEIKLFALSNNVHEVSGAETLCPEKSTLLGPCMVIGQEYPNIRTKSIDLELSGHVGERESAADLVLGEFLNPDSNLFVAYRNAQRWVQSYEPVVLGNTGYSRPPFREDGVYLITGGLGKIGIAISEYLAEKYRAKLVLVGRSSLPGRESWDAWIASHGADDPVHARIHTIQRIEKLGGSVLHVNASVADASAMRAVIKQAYQRFGALHGVIHGAGIVGDDGYREIKDSDHDNCDGHFQAKALGLLVLEDVLDGKPLDFCLLLSSLTSVLGGIGQAAYAASNIYMDSFARRHNRSSPVPWLSVNWDVWRLHDHAAMGSGFGTTLKELGMSAQEAMQTMETALAVRTASQLVVSTGDLGARIDQWIKLEPLNTRGPATAVGPIQSAVSRQPRPQTNYDAPRDETERRIARIWQDALGMDQVGINDSFAQLGGHSLLAIRIVAELRRAFHTDLPVRVLFDAPTVAELSNHIKRHIVAEIDSLSDEEARQLVSNE
jgi:acyl transferase domain-containing protein/acyl carrier protein